jgi:NAD(P)-dependent dehydrogenase (short-subunit alcohol dehydrogenase family)
MADLSGDSIKVMNLRGAIVIVTGAASGIGRATALTLSTRGASVVAVDRDASALAVVVGLTGGPAVTTDVADPKHAEHVVSETLGHFGRLDAVVANAGIGYDGAFATMPVEAISDLLDINLRAPMLLARAALPVLLAAGRGGALVFTTSIAGAVPVPNEAAYGASKTALEAFADALREEVRPAGIAVSTVRPGVVRTKFHDGRNVPYARRFPRPIPPERVAEAIAGVLESGADRRTVPPWLGLAATARATVPWAYRAVARRVGGA